MLPPTVIEYWSVEIAGPGDAIVLLGLVDGLPYVTRPIATFSMSEGYARDVDGAGYVLDTPRRTSPPPRPGFLRGGWLKLRRAEAALDRIRRGQSPTARELAHAIRLDEWTVQVRRGPAVLIGRATGNPRFVGSEQQVFTTPVLWIAEDLRAARTVNHFYQLGTPIDPLRLTA